MYWVERDGVRLPRRVGGDVALDLCNTLAGWEERPSERREWLTGYDLLVRWAEYADLVSPDDLPRLLRTASRRRSDAEDALSRARALRLAVHRAATEPGHAGSLRTVSAFAREAAAHGGLVADGDGVRWGLGRSAGLAQPVLAAARAAESFLTTADLSHVRSCPGLVCGWLFLDRTGRRRWCSMADCGNRAKVAAHARRHRTGG